MEVEQQQTGVPDGWEVVTAPLPSPPPAKGRDFKVLGINIHVPAEEKPRADSNILGTPSGSGIAPEDLLMAGQAGRAIVGAAKGGGALAGAAEAVTQAAPLLKYEATKTLLRAMKVPEPFATVLAGAVAGYRKGAKGEPAAPSTMPPAGVETAQEALARKMASAPPTGAAVAPAPSVAPVASAPAPQGPPLAAPGPPVGPGVRSVAPSPMSVPPPSAPPQGPRMGPDGLLVGRPGGNPELPDQRALNEAALAARRTATPAPPATKPMLLAAEAKEFVKMLQSGKTAKEAMDLIVAQRELQARLGLKTPTPAETRFPKGMRGGSPE